MNNLHIHMLGEFSLSAGESKIADSSNRSKKVWLLLAFLICNRSRIISGKELVDLLWGDDPSSSNPENALKITFHRARALLDTLWENAGHQLIVHRDGGYVWNSEVPCTLDTEEFDRLCQTSAADEDTLLSAYLSALELYHGEFLNKLSTESWIVPMTAYYHNLYIQTVLQTVPVLMSRGEFQQAADLCRAAIPVEPYHEGLYQLLMQALAALNDQSGAAAAYEELSSRLFTDFGIKPSEETRTVYRAATRSLSEQVLPMETVMEHLQEPNAREGALECDYHDFKILCHAETRSMLRSGKATHIALFSVSGRKPLSTRSLNCAMDNLGTQIRVNLRRGDTFSRCSASQYILMLPQANYENSCMVCRRILAAFSRKFPHSPASLHFIVQPLGQNALDL